MILTRWHGWNELTLARAFAFFTAGLALLLPILGLRSDGIVPSYIYGKAIGIKPVLTLVRSHLHILR